MSDSEKLEQAYLEGLMKGYWDLEDAPSATCYTGLESNEYADLIINLETVIFGSDLTSKRAAETYEWARALATWTEWDNSPFAKR